MAKTYNTIPTVATGDLLTATAWNNQATNVNNYRVPPMCVVYLNSSTQPYTSDTDISWKAEYEDTDSMWAVGDPTKIYTTTAGLYAVSFSGWVQAGAGSFGSNDASSRVYKSGTLQSMTMHNAIASNTQIYWTFSTIVRCTSSDYLTFRFAFSSATNVALTGGTTENHQQTRASVAWLGQVS